MASTALTLNYHHVLILIASYCLVLPPLATACGDNLFSPMTSVVRDAFLLTEGESLRLSCSVCGICLPVTDPGCSNRNNQVWMTKADQEKAEIRSRTSIKDSKTKVDSFRNFVKVMKEKAERVKKKTLKVALTARHYMALAVQRFDRLKRLGMESDSGVGILKELWNEEMDDSRLQWFVETADGQVSRVKHDSRGRVLLFDLLIISRANAGNTGTYTCKWSGQVRAQFGVTVVEGGVEPYREFETNSGRSLQPKLLSKANLEVYTRWMGLTRSLLLPAPNSPAMNNSVDAVNTSLTWGICFVKQLDADRPVMPEGSPSLKLMPHGLPCRSHLLPLSVRSLRSIIRRPSETRKVRIRVRVHESMMHFGLSGANYTTASPPPLSVDATVIKRSFMMAKQGEFVSLQCPLRQTVRTLIAWFVLKNETDSFSANLSESTSMISTEEILEGALNPFNLRESTRGRMFTDPGGNLNIANVTKTTDQRKYYCLHKGRLVGYVNLIIRHAKEESQVMYVSSLIMNVLRVASPLVITASIIFLTLVTASSMFEPEVPW